MKVSILETNQNTINEVKLADGIYFTDYRKTSNSLDITKNKCFKEAQIAKGEYKINQNMEILIPDFKEFGQKIEALDRSIKEIMEVENWENDKIFFDAVFEDYEIIIKYLNYQQDILNEIIKMDANCSVFSSKSPQQILEDITEKVEIFKKQHFSLKSTFIKENKEENATGESDKQELENEKEGLFL